MTAPAPLPRLVELDTFKLWPGVIVEAGQESSAEFVLDAASAAVRLESGNPDRWADLTADPVPASIVSVVIEVAARAWRNPECAAMRVDGPFTESFAQGVVDALYLTPANLRTVSKVIGETATPGLWTQPLTRGDDDPSLPYIVDEFSGEQVPRSPYPTGLDWTAP